MSSLITITKAAPSLICDELPAVTLPPAANTGLSLFKMAVEVPALGPSSLFTVYFLVAFLPSAPT